VYHPFHTFETKMSKSHFSIKNIPFGIGSSSNHPARTVVTRFEDTVIFLDELAKIHAPLLSKETIAAFSCKTVNDFAALPRAEQSLTRKWIQSIIYKSFDILSPSCTSAVEAAGGWRFHRFLMLARPCTQRRRSCLWEPRITPRI